MDKQQKINNKCSECNKKLKVSDCDYANKCLKCYTLAYHSQFYDVIFNKKNNNRLLK
jgi:hypothetical protein